MPFFVGPKKSGRNSGEMSPFNKRWICVLSQSNLFRRAPPPLPSPLYIKFRRTFLEFNSQKPYPKKKGKNRRRLFTSSIKREVEYLGSVHTYLNIFESETFSFRERLASTHIQ